MHQVIGQMYSVKFQKLGKPHVARLANQSGHVGTSSRTETHKDFFLGKFLYCTDSEALKHAAQRGCGLIIPEDIQDQAGWSSA